MARGRGSRLKTMWEGVSGAVTLDDFDVSSTLLVTTGTGAAQSADYHDTTLVRTIGAIAIDPNFSASAITSQIAHFAAALYVGPTAPTAEIFDTAGGGGAAFSPLMQSDRVIWSGLTAQSGQVAITAGTDSELMASYHVAHPVLEVDSEAQRKMGDDNNIYLVIQGLGGTDAVGGFASFYFRFLFRGS